jgi:hypothetical protein
VGKKKKIESGEEEREGGVTLWGGGRRDKGADREREDECVGE